MGGVRMSEDEGDEKGTRGLFFFSCCLLRSPPLPAITPTHIYTNTYIHRPLKCAHMLVFRLYVIISNIQKHISSQWGKESVQSAPGSPGCTHILHSVADMTKPSAPQAMDSHVPHQHVMLHLNSCEHGIGGSIQQIVKLLGGWPCLYSLNKKI